MSKLAVQSLGEHFDEFVERRLEAGEYDTAEDVIRAGLRLLERRQRKIEALRAAIQEGIDSGDPQPFDIKQFLREMQEASEAE